ncbi:MAG: hypothetical protein D6719_10220 [Candidatus Dadabacteria bacterium]|nr:MAG: hypothetical protein D6719_10220 [Candidatus Dadabacteria bacterium]
MPEIKNALLYTLSILLLTGLVVSYPAVSEEKLPEATLYSARGTVEIRRAGEALWQRAEKGSQLYREDLIRTGAASRAGLKFSGGKLVRLREHSQLKIELPADKKGRLNLLSGAIYLFSRASKKFPEVKTSHVSAAIRGTEIVVNTSSEGTRVAVLNGAVELKNSQGELALKSGEKGEVDSGGSLKRLLIVKPEKEVQWVLAYPVPVSRHDFNLSFKSLADREFFKAAVARAYSGDYEHALLFLNKIKDGSPAVKVFRAGMYLAAGAVEKAIKLHQSMTNNRTAGLYAAILKSQQAVLALVQNDKISADKLVKEAYALSPDSVTVLLVKALKEQSELDLKAAEETLNQALKLEPDNVEALSRLAEIKLASGRIEEAIKLAERAASLAPDYPYALNAAGFSNLAAYNTERARRYFKRSVDSNPASGEAYLGLGLSDIREGRLSDGRAEIEKAVTMEPMRALYRSYLGKAFFEEEREDLAEEEYSHAISIDPNDPTPYLYRAFNRLSRNRPIEALSDIEDSIARNNNRAVYRSRFLLDQDLAVRGTSLAEVFNRLGFSQIARLEAIKSINRDYSNYSAHRLLSESFDGFFFADAAFSEGIISDLLAPVSFNVFANQTGFSGAAGLNEYSALFDRNQNRTGIQGSYSSEKSRAAGSVFETGKIDNFGYFLGYRGGYGRGRKSGGFYERLNRADLAAQYQLNHNNRVIAQTAFIGRDNVEPDVSDKADEVEASIGTHHVLSTNSQIVTRVEYLDRSFDTLENRVSREASEQVKLDTGILSFPDETITVNQTTDERFKSWRFSGQYIYDSEALSLVLGGQALDASGDSLEESMLLLDSTGFFSDLGADLTSSADYSARSYSGYLYGTLHLADWFDLNAAVNYSDIELPAFDVIAPFIDGTRSKDKWSPKAGVILYPADNLIIRAAYFRSLGISSESDIGSIEPTTIGGFTQVFGDLPGAESESYAAGIDWKLPKKLYAGVEYLYRDIERESITVKNVLTIDATTASDNFTLSSASARDNERDEQIRAYLYAVLCKRATATLDYIHSELTSFAIDEVLKTDRLALALNYFLPSRWFGFLRGSYINQDANGVDTLKNGGDSFWLFDAGLGYRLPYRHGAVRLAVNNIFDQNFIFEDRGRNREIFPEINGRLEFSVNF